MRTNKTGVPKGDYPELQNVLRSCLRVEGYDLDGHDGATVRKHVSDLDAIPRELLRKVAGAGLSGVLAGPGSVAQLPGYSHLAKIQVCGYPIGTTWLDVAGAYDRENRVILLGTSPVVEPHVVPTSSSIPWSM